MRLSEMLTAIREYPALKIQYEAMREQQASQARTAVQLSIAYNNLQIGNRKLSQKNKALESALVKLVPRLNSREHCRRLYKAVAPCLDPGGFVLYRSAAELTRFHISTEFATEDNMGKFEKMDGYGMLRYLTADRFGSVEYEIVAPCYPADPRPCPLRTMRCADAPAYQFQTCDPGKLDVQQCRLWHSGADQ